METQKKSRSTALKAAFPVTVPVMTGYLCLGMAFGVLMKAGGYGPLWSAAMSIVVFAGSMQFLTISLLTAAFDPLQAFLLAVMVNARHIFYGISLLDTYADAGKKKSYMIFGLTDETYSLVTQNQPPEGMGKATYCFLVTAFNHVYWICGCVLGNLAGSYIPISFEGVEFVLTALFVTLFVEQWLTHKNHLPAIIGVVVTVACLAIFGKEIFLIPSMVLIAVLLIVSRKTGRRKEDA